MSDEFQWLPFLIHERVPAAQLVDLKELHLWVSAPA
jgi:hypothetical protein